MVSISELKRRASRLDGMRLETAARHRGFRLHLSDEGPAYVPETSGEVRDDTWDRISKVLDRFNETRSLRPGDYQDLTHHASYVLATLQALFPEIASEQPAVLGAQQRKSEEVSTSAVDKAHQRVGAVSNAHVGRDFERVAYKHFLGQGIELMSDYPVDIGLSTTKPHRFDLGAARPPILVECKSHRWTAGDKVPSAKMTVWNEAMYYFLLAPPEYRKCFFVLHDKRGTTGETLLEYYVRTYSHLIPKGVEFLEWDEARGRLVG